MTKSGTTNTQAGGSPPGVAAKRLTGVNALEAGIYRLMEIIDFFPDATFVIDSCAKVIAWNKAIEKMTGIPRKQILGKGDYAYAVPFYGRPVPMLIDLALNPEKEGAGGHDSITKNGGVLVFDAMIPIFKGRAGACLSSTASPLHDRDKNLIGAIESIRDVTTHKRLEQRLHESEKDIEDKARQLEDINTALRVLIKSREEDRKKFASDIQSNLSKLILPYLDRVKKGKLDQDQKTYLELIESSLQKIFSPFIVNINSAFSFLTPMEIQVANLTKEGKTGKEIASLLGVAYKTVETHRYNLRMKLGIQNEKINLRTYLLSIT